jgi:hypothetical protein
VLAPVLVPAGVDGLHLPCSLFFEGIQFPRSLLVEGFQFLPSLIAPTA